MASRVLAFVRDEGNRAVLGWIGGGLVVLATGLWAVYVHFYPAPEAKPSNSIEVHNGNVIASGPNATFNAPVTINPDAKEAVAPINERLDKLAAQVAREKGVEVAPLRSVLGKLGEKGVREEDIPKRLDAAADELIKLRAEIEQFRHGAPALAAIAQEAQTLIDKGDLDGARKALVRGREAARAQRSDASRNEAKFLALDARVDDLQLAYRSAAAKYAEAASLVAPFDTKQQRRFLFDQAGELYKQGNEFGDNAALVEAIDLYRRDLALAPRSERPLDWAHTQVNLGNALVSLGERESGTARLEEAVAAYREALQELTHARVPLQWAATQMNLGVALWRLGERESGTARLEEAVAAYREALRENTRERAPLDWAATQMDLGNALGSLGGRESGSARLEEAVAAYREALQERSRARAPLEWALTQTNLGNALADLGERESGTARLEEVVAAFREALQENTRARLPLEWARTQNNLGTALKTLGEQESGTARLEEAVSAYRAALEERTRARHSNGPRPR
jgi:tetratricopeptide (TPR) repeat protein